MQGFYIKRDLFGHKSLVLLVLLLVGVISSRAQCTFSSNGAGEFCSKAVHVCGSDLHNYKSKLPDTLASDYPWTSLCNVGSVENIIWFSFVPCSDTVTLLITPSNCTTVGGGFSGMQAGFYSGCKQGKSIACMLQRAPNIANGLIAPFILTSTQFNAGEAGYLFLDGYAGSVCDFTIQVISGISLNVMPTPNTSNFEKGFIAGPNNMECKDLHIPIQYNLTPPQCDFAFDPNCTPPQINYADSVCFQWSVSPGTTAIFNQGKNTGENVEIIFNAPGTYQISSQAILHPLYGGSCASGACADINTWTVNISGPDTITNPIIYNCAGATVNVCGQLYSSDTTIICEVDPCNFEIQQILFSPSLIRNLGTQYICRGSSFNWQGVEYSTSGYYEVLDANDCNLVNTFTVENVDFTLTVEGIDTITCFQKQLTLNSLYTTNSQFNPDFFWIKEGGEIVHGGQNDAIITEPGNYSLSAILSLPSGTECNYIQNFTIIEDTKIPEITSFIPTVTCRSQNDPLPILTTVSSDNILSSKWTTPLGLQQVGMNIIVDSLNAIQKKPYVFELVGENGCKLDTSFIIPINFATSEVEITGDDLTCFKPKSILTMTSSLPWSEVRWERIDANITIYYNSNNNTTILVDTSGLFRANVKTTTSKCWSSGDKYIANNKIRPTITFEEPELWHCNTQSLYLDPIVTADGNLQYQWTTYEGTINSDVRNRQIEINSSGTYYIKVFNESNGCQKQDTIQIIDDSNIPKNLMFDLRNVSCFNEKDGTLSVLGVLGGYEPYSYFLGNEKIMPNKPISSLAPGSYSLLVKDKYNCEYEQTLTINEPEEIFIDLPVSIEFEFNEIGNLSFSTNYNDTDITSIEWITKSGEILGNDYSIEYNAVNDEIVKVNVITRDGCSKSATIEIRVDNEVQFYIPNVFSPNGDNNNDIFYFGKNNIPVEIIKFSIYDRIGNLVFNEEKFLVENMKGWDGTHRNQNAEQGVYVYLIEYVDFFNNKNIIKGNLTLMR